MAGWDLDRGIYALATGLFRFNYLPIVTIALAQSAVEVLPLITGPGRGVAVLVSLASAVLGMGLSYLLLYTLMTGESALQRPFPWPNLEGYILRTLALALLLAVVPLLPLLLVALPFVLADPGPLGRVVAGIAIGVIWLLISLATFGLFGTVLPDLLAGGAGRFGDAWRRGRGKLGSFFKWMAIGPAAAFAVLLLTLLLLGRVLAMADAEIAGAERQPLWLAGLLTLLSAIGSAYLGALVTVVLGKTWAAGGGIITPAREAH